MTDCTATRHGNASAYGNYGCRCDTARQAKLRQQKTYALRFTVRGQRSLRDVTGTRRRLEALHALGWRASDLGPMLRLTASAVSKVRGSARVQAGTAEAIAKLYDRLADRRGPSEITAQRAAAAGWLEPKWWDDDTLDDPTYEPPTTDERHWSDVDPVAVERAKAGDDVSLTRAERICAVLELDDEQISHREIGRRLRVATRQVLRDLAEHRERLAS